METDLSSLKFDNDGLIPAIIQDHANGDVLMVAFMNRESLNRTLQTELTHFFSRSRKKIWQKGESSGHVQTVRGIFYDCDGDALLIKVDQKVAACHTGHRSCFYRSLEGQETAEVVFDADSVYRDALKREILDRLYAVVVERKKRPRSDSYTSRLMEGGVEVSGKKLIEECRELVMAAGENSRKKVVHEAADLLYHMLVVLGLTSVHPDDVMEELMNRFGRSGIEEKASRGKRR